MPDRVAFTACIAERLSERYGPKRVAELTDRFNGLADGFEHAGHGSDMASTLASAKLFDDLSYERAETLKRTQKQLEVQAAVSSRLDQAADAKAGVLSLFGGPSKSEGFRLAQSVKSMIEADPRYAGLTVEKQREYFRNKWWATMSASLEHYAKASFGKNKATAQMLNDFVDEAFGRDTGNAAAKEFADSWQKVLKMIPADYNAAGGSMRGLGVFNLPQRQNPLKMKSQGEWVKDWMGWADWDRMRWPNGAPIEPGQRADALRAAWVTLSSDGANKIDPTAAGGRGRAIGNMLDEHRFLLLKDGESWRAMNAKYGDGNAFDAVAHHVDAMAHRTALVQQFGPNPELAMKNMRAQVEKRAGALTSLDQAEANHVLNKVVQPMFDNYTRANPTSPVSRLPAYMSATANVLTAAQLGSTTLLAVPGDWHTILTQRLANGLPMFDGVGQYAKYLTTDAKLLEQMNAQNGFVHSAAVSGTYTTERYHGIQTYGPSVTKAITDGVMHLSLLERHTETARSVVRNELMGYMARNLDKTLDELPAARMFRRYGIGDAEWDAVRKNVAPAEMGNGAMFLRHLDIADSKLANARELSMQFFQMIQQEAAYAVPGTSLEGQTFLRGTTKPDTLYGVILHSFGMYKNFPVTMAQQYGRLAMSLDTGTRVKYLAALGVGMLGVGAVGLQLRELAKGREPLNMKSAKFMGDALLAGGAMSLWGDFLFSGVNQVGQGPNQMIGGPIGGLATDLINAEIGPAFKWIDAMDQGKNYRGNWTSRQVELLKRYTPGTSLWYARLVLEREIWDKLDLMADPVNARKKFANRIANQRRDYGNRYYAPPGQGL